MTRKGNGRRISGAIVLFATFATLVAISAPATAAGNGKGKGSGSAAVTAPCSVVDGVVYGTGLPTGEVINFMVTDASGTGGWVLGFTPDGMWTVNVPPASGPTTYEFASRTFGPNGAKYNVFQSCSV